MDVLREAFVQAVLTGNEAALDPVLAEQQRLASPSSLAAAAAAPRRARVRPVAEPRPPQHPAARWRHARLGSVEGAALPDDPDREPRPGAGHGPGRAVPARSAGRRAGDGVPRLDRLRRQLDRGHRRRRRSSRRHSSARSSTPRRRTWSRDAFGSMLDQTVILSIITEIMTAVGRGAPRRDHGAQSSRGRPRATRRSAPSSRRPPFQRPRPAAVPTDGPPPGPVDERVAAVRAGDLRVPGVRARRRAAARRPRGRPLAPPPPPPPR